MDELEEVTQELSEKEMSKREDIESGDYGKEKNGTTMDSAERLLSLFFSPVFAQAFLLTFLAEWGDRSQIASMIYSNMNSFLAVALAGAHNWLLVSIGSLFGHAICTSIAVIGGSLLASRISVKHLTFFGGILFILCGLVSFYETYQVATLSKFNLHK